MQRKDYYYQIRNLKLYNYVYILSERFRLLWKCHLFDYSTYIQFCVHWHGVQCLRQLVPNYAVVFQLLWMYSPVTVCYRRSRRRYTYLGSSVQSTEKDIDTRLRKAWTAIDRLSIIWKSNLKRSFFQEAVMSILLYGCTTWTLTKWLEKKLDGNYTRMLQAILNKSWQQHPTRHQLYGHLLPITKTIQARRTRHAGHCWRSMDELISDVLLWTPAYSQAKAGRPARTYIQQLCEDTGCSPEDLPEAMNDREEWRERVRDICASVTTWWWWWYILETISV